VTVMECSLALACTPAAPLAARREQPPSSLASRNIGNSEQVNQVESTEELASCNAFISRR
jgi:hypothetical protein